MDKRFLAIVAVIIAIFVGIFVFSQARSDNNGGASNGDAQPTNHVKGEGAKGVTLIEYGDFQCPVCGLYEPIIQQVYERFSKDIYFQFRHLPLVSIHPNAFAAARAAEAASLQNKFWEMHDKLFEKQTEWSGSNNVLSLFKSYAQEIGLNVDQFTADYAKDEVNDAINADLAEFGKTGQDQSTPTFFIDGKHIDTKDLAGENGAPSVDKFAELINNAIAQKSQN